MKLIVATAMMIGLAAAAVLGQAGPTSRGPFRVLGFHFTLAPGKEAFYREQFEKVSRLGYVYPMFHNLVILKLKEEMRK